MIYKFLFPLKPDSAGASLFLLILRISFGLLLINHGIQKCTNLFIISHIRQSLQQSIAERYLRQIQYRQECDDAHRQ